MSGAVELAGRQLVTPAAVRLGDPEPGSPEWLALRLAGITGTDVAKILGYSKYGNARTVWHDKHGELPDEEAGEAAEWGNILEPVIAEQWSRRHAVICPSPIDGEPVRRRVVPERGGILANVAEPWMRSQVDYLLPWCPDAPGAELLNPDARWCALEVKTRSAFVASRWGRDVPDDVLAQVAWQRLVGGFDHVHVAVLLGGQELVEFRYDEDRELESYVLQAAAVAWHDVQYGLPPAGGENPALVRALERMAARRGGEVEINDEEYARLRALWEERRAAKEDAEQADAAFKVALLDALQGADVVTLGGTPVWSYKPVSRRSISVKNVESLAGKLYDDLKAAGLVTTTTSRRLSGD